MNRDGTVAVVAGRAEAVELVDLLRRVTTLEPVVIAPRRFAPLTTPYAGAALAVVAAPRAIPAAILASRLFRVPWVAASPHGVRPRLLDEAAAVLLGQDARAGDSVWRQSRAVLREDEERLRSLLEDLALAQDAVGIGGSALSAALANGWMFVNDRLTRAAIRLVPITGKSTMRVHPKHLVQAPWHFWYDGELRAADRVLDIGCGTGVHTVHAATRVRSVVAVDVDARNLEIARTLVREAGAANVEFRRGDLVDPNTLVSLRDEPFDAVLLLDVLEHVVRRDELLQSVRSLLRPGGRLLVSVPHRDTPYKRWRRSLGGFAYSDEDHKIEYSEQLVRKEFQAAGFDVLVLQRGGYDTPFSGVTAFAGAVSLTAYRLLAMRRARLAARRPQHATAFRVVATPWQD